MALGVGSLELGRQLFATSRQNRQLTTATINERRRRIQQAIERKMAHEEAQRQRSAAGGGTGGKIGTAVGAVAGGIAGAGNPLAISAGASIGGAVGGAFDTGGSSSGSDLGQSLIQSSRYFGEPATINEWWGGGSEDLLHSVPAVGRTSRTPGAVIPRSVTQEALQRVGG